MNFDPKTAKLTNKFIVTANIEASDGGKAIIAGNERVIRARLSDAKFFYETDLKTKLEDRLPKFDGIVFHEKLGTQGERIKRIELLAAEIAPLVGADVEKTKRAAHLAKADLLTEVFWCRRSKTVSRISPSFFLKSSFAMLGVSRGTLSL